jgi:hypothetical protein
MSADDLWDITFEQDEQLARAARRRWWWRWAL